MSHHRAILAVLVAVATVLASVPVAPCPAPASAAAQTVSAGIDGYELIGLSGADLALDLDFARAAGMRRVRVLVDWSAIEIIQGSRDWSIPDRVINAVVRHGMSPLGLVAFAPTWAANSGTHGSPQDPNLFASFAAAAATRYRAKLRRGRFGTNRTSRPFGHPPRV